MPPLAVHPILRMACWAAGQLAFARTVTLDDIAARITPRTRLLAISSVQWSSGYRVELAALGALCRERNIWFVVDAIQQLGAVPIDVRATPIDSSPAAGTSGSTRPSAAASSM